jgi:chromosome segregation ATPase
MQTQALVEIALAVQLTLVGLFLLRAVARSLRLRQSTPVQAASHAAGDPSHHEGSASDDAAVAQAAEELTAMRRKHAETEASFAARRRAALLEMRDHQRRTADLAAEERDLEERVTELRTEVRHFEQRHVALTAEIRAALESSELLRERTATGRRQLEKVQADRARVRARFIGDTERLRDLVRRRELLRAETEELSELLELLQKLAGEPITLTGLSDGELRERASEALEAGERSDARSLAADRAPAKGLKGRARA